MNVWIKNNQAKTEIFRNIKNELFVMKFELFM